MVLNGLVLEGDLRPSLDLLFLGAVLPLLVLGSLDLLVLVSDEFDFTIGWLDTAAALCSHFYYSLL